MDTVDKMEFSKQNSKKKRLMDFRKSLTTTTEVVGPWCLHTSMLASRRHITYMQKPTLHCRTPADYYYYQQIAAAAATLRK